MVSGLRKINRFNQAKGWFGVCAGLLSSAALAVTQEIRAVYIPDPANPQTNTFINQTPQSGYCGNYPNDCKPLSGVRLPLRFASVQAVEPGASERNGAMFSMPAQWRSLVVTNVFTGESATVEMRIGGFGSQYVLSDTAVNLTGEASDQQAHHRLWGTSWGFAPLPCRAAAMSSYGPDFYRFFWKTPVEGTCAKQTAFMIPWMSYGYLDVAYELRTPNPLQMSAGLYTGALTYGVGPGMDIDTGDNLLPDNSAVTFRFVLDVQHVLKVDIPPGGNKVVLVPQGGWQTWLQQGRKPVRLFRDQTFNISSSSRFKMFIECQHGGAQSCGLRDTEGGGADAQVFVSVSLPDSITDHAGQPVRRRPLTSSPNAPGFQPDRFLDRTAGTLHFEVPREYVEQMLQPGQARRYAGNVTVIWDSEV
ncbi:hypothetical protein [Pseudomonas sp. MWU12-2029]|uniref:hypothetical protein n=1 Tax=Pseudomonas sp. MWU12-2029 TaxID=2927805 RepID=UPI00200FB48A|nr:hypothetical protein [Pseudomonas sp. MWU12-2029]